MSNDDDDHDINARRKPTRGPAQHNEVEKKRRAYLSSCYVDLKMLVPSIANVKASNVTILQTAASGQASCRAIATAAAGALCFSARNSGMSPLLFFSLTVSGQASCRAIATAAGALYCSVMCRGCCHVPIGHIGRLSL